MGVLLRCSSFIPRVDARKSWEEMPVRDSKGKMQATAPYGYARDDGDKGCCCRRDGGGNIDGGISRETLGKGELSPLGRRAQAPKPALTWHTIHTPPSLLAGTLVYLTRLVQCQLIALLLVALPCVCIGVWQIG